MSTERGCGCLKIGPRDYELAEVGVDETNGRYGEVTLRTCRGCGRIWLHYLVEYEAFSQSGRWYTAVISPDVAASLTPERAVPILEGLPWHVFGGSHFRSTGKRGTGPILVDL